MMNRRYFFISDINCTITVEYATRKEMLELIDNYVENCKTRDEMIASHNANACFYDMSQETFTILYKDGTIDYIDEEFDGHHVKRQHIASIINENSSTIIVYGCFGLNECGVAEPTFSDEIDESLKEVDTDDYTTTETNNEESDTNNDTTETNNEESDTNNDTTETNNEESDTNNDTTDTNDTTKKDINTKYGIINNTITELENLFDTVEKYKNSYLWHGDNGNISAREYKEKQDSIDVFEWYENGDKYTVEFTVKYTRNNVYAKGIYTKNGKQTTLTAIKNSYNRLLQAVQRE